MVILQGRTTTHTATIGQNRIYTPYLTVYLMKSLPNILYINSMYLYGIGKPYKQQSCQSKEPLCPLQVLYHCFPTICSTLVMHA